MKTIGNILLVVGGITLAVTFIGALVYAIYVSFTSGNVLALIALIGLSCFIVGFIITTITEDRYKTWNEVMNEHYDDIHRNNS